MPSIVRMSRCCSVSVPSHSTSVPEGHLNPCYGVAPPGPQHLQGTVQVRRRQLGAAFAVSFQLSFRYPLQSPQYPLGDGSVPRLFATSPLAEFGDEDSENLCLFQFRTPTLGHRKQRHHAGRTKDAVLNTSVSAQCRVGIQQGDPDQVLCDSGWQSRARCCASCSSVLECS
jgi:hypothetical protein